MCCYHRGTHKSRMKMRFLTLLWSFSIITAPEIQTQTIDYLDPIRAKTLILHTSHKHKGWCFIMSKDSNCRRIVTPKIQLQTRFIKPRQLHVLHFRRLWQSHRSEGGRGARYSSVWPTCRISGLYVCPFRWESGNRQTHTHTDDVKTITSSAVMGCKNTESWKKPILKMCFQTLLKHIEIRQMVKKIQTISIQCVQTLTDWTEIP